MATIPLVATIPMLATIVFAAAAGLMACAGAPGGADVPAGASSGGSAQESGAVRTEGGLRVAVSLVAAPVPGEPVEIRLDVTNESDREVVLDFSNGQRYDFEILADGRSIWRWAADMFFIQVLGRERIAPGEALTWTERYEAGLPAGDYVAAATLTTTPRVVVELSFEVGP
jgi:hypothetical protein